MLLHLEPSELRRGRRWGRGNWRQRRQGQPLNHNYNKVSARRIRTCGSPTQSGLINLQKPRFFCAFFFPHCLQRWCHFPSNKCAISPVALASQLRTQGEGELYGVGGRIPRPAKNKKCSSLKPRNQVMGVRVVFNAD